MIGGLLIVSLIVFLALLIGFILSVLITYAVGKRFTAIVSPECSANVTLGKTFLYTIFKVAIIYGASYIVGALYVSPLLEFILPKSVTTLILFLTALILIFILTTYLFSFRNIACTATWLVSDFISSLIATAIVIFFAIVIGGISYSILASYIQ